MGLGLVFVDIEPEQGVDRFGLENRIGTDGFGEAEEKESGSGTGLGNRLHLATSIASCSLTALENMEGRSFCKGIAHFVKENFV